MEEKDGLAKENPFIKMEKAADSKREEKENANHNNIKSCGGY